MRNLTICTSYLILLRRMILTRHVAYVGATRCAYKIFTGKPWGEIAVDGADVKMCVREISYEIIHVV
jgi:hypothetical protein